MIGGSGLYAKGLVEELSKLGHEVVVFAPYDGLSSEGDERGPRVEGVGVSRQIPFMALQYWARLGNALRSEMARERFDIVHFNGLSYPFKGRPFGQLPHVLTVHHLVVDAARTGNVRLGRRLFGLGHEEGWLLPMIREALCSFCRFHHHE